MKGAALPEHGYERPNSLIRVGDKVIVRVFSENGSSQKDFDFQSFQLGEELELAFAEGFDRATGPGGTRRTNDSTKNLYSGLRAFAKLLNAASNPPRALSDLRPAHIAGLRLHGTRHAQSIVMAIRVVLRGNASLPAPFRELLFAPMKSAAYVRKVSSYSESEFRAIRRSARTEIRAALKRVRTMEAELAAWQQHSDEVVDPEVARRGNLLAFIAANGDLPRYESGLVNQYGPYKDSPKIFRALFPTLSELAAIVVLMQCLKGQNVSTICELTTAHARADDQEGEYEVLLIRAQKRRRGRHAAEMDISFTSMPVWLDEGGKDDDDFASPFGLFKIAEELCHRARAFAGSERLLCAYSDRRRETTFNGLGFRGINQVSGSIWNGWIHEDKHCEGIDTMRLRRTFLELHQRPVAQKSSTLADTYLSKDPGSLPTYQAVVDDALSDEVNRIRATNTIRTLSEEEVREAAQAPEALAIQLGISAGKLKELLDGRLDTIAAACVDPNNGPYDPAGQACTASFLLCLGCPNARSEPRHIPVQSLLSKRIRARKLEMPAEQWAQRYQVADEQLQDLLRDQRADVDEMALQTSDHDFQMVEALLDGRYDIR